MNFLNKIGELLVEAKKTPPNFVPAVPVFEQCHDCRLGVVIVVVVLWPLQSLHCGECET